MANKKLDPVGLINKEIEALEYKTNLVAPNQRPHVVCKPGDIFAVDTNLASRRPNHATKKV